MTAHEKYFGGRLRPIGGGRYQADVSIYPERLRRSFKSRDEAARWIEAQHAARRLDRRPLTFRESIEYNDATRLLPSGVSIVEAAKFYAAHHRAGPLAGRTVAQCVDAYLAARESVGLRPRTIGKLRSVLHRLADGFQGREVDRVTTADVQAWLDGLGVAPATVDTFCRTLATFWRWCIRQGATTTDATDGLQVQQWDTPAPAIYTPEQTHDFLAAVRRVRPDLLGVFAVQFYAGLRTSESLLVTWADIGPDYLAVRPAVAKKRRQRLVPVLPCLAAALAATPRRCDRVSPVEDRALIAARQAIHAGDWPHNVARHSFISYRLAATQSADQVALEAGNSRDVIFEHYRALVTPADAARYFGAQKSRKKILHG